MEERDKETELQRPMEPAEEEVAGEEKQGKREKGSLASDLFDWAEALVYALALLVVCYLLILQPVSLLGSWLERRLRYA